MEDIVGETSAGLLAAGVPLERRRRALRLLGILESVAGPDLRIRRPLTDVAVEFGLDPTHAQQAVDDLLRAGTLYDLDGELVLLDAEPEVDSPFRLHDFLAVVEDLDAQTIDRRRWPVPAVGALVAAALLVFALVSTDAPAPQDRLTADGVAARVDRPTTSEADPEAPSSPGRRVPTSDRSAAVVTGPTSTVTTVPAPLSCPTDDPIIEMVEAVPDLSGRIRNDSGTEALVHSIVVHGLEIPVDLTIPAHGTVVWSADPTTAPPAGGVPIELGQWEWVRCR